MEKTIERTRLAGEMLRIQEAVKKAAGVLDRMKELDKITEDERQEWREEKEVLTKKIKELEEKIEMMELVDGGYEEKKRNEAERKLEEEIKEVKPMSEEEWAKEKAERKWCALNLVVTGTDMEDSREKVGEMMKAELDRGYKEDRLSERTGRDGHKRWFYRMDREEEVWEMVEKMNKIKKDWNLKVGVDRTFRQRKTRQVLERRADVERLRNKRAKIRVEKEKISVDGNWERWDEKEARWTAEKEWKKREAEKKKRRLERELEKTIREINGSDEDEGAGAVGGQESEEEGGE